MSIITLFRRKDFPDLANLVDFFLYFTQCVLETGEWCMCLFWFNAQNSQWTIQAVSWSKIALGKPLFSCWYKFKANISSYSTGTSVPFNGRSSHEERFRGKNVQIYLQFLAKDLRMCFLAFSCIKLLRDIVLGRSSPYLILF